MSTNEKNPCGTCDQDFIDGAVKPVTEEFQAARPNQKWVADITYLPTFSGWVYLEVVLESFSRKLVDWSIT